MTLMAADSETPALQVKNLTVSLHTPRGTVRAVNDVSFAVERGKTLGIVGESGCGKTILCRTLIGLLPDCAVVGGESRVAFNGKGLLRLPDPDLNKIRGMKIAMVFQDPLSSLNPVMTIGRQIAEALVYHLGMKWKDADFQAIELLRSVGIPSPERRARQYPHQLSGGMRQRVAIAIALSCKPKLLIADEPTTALDVTVQEAVLDLLVLNQTERKMAIILVTHDLGIAASRAHEIAVMYAGRLVERISAQQLFDHVRMPYTRALVDALPKMNQPPHTPLRSIDGQPPDLAGEIGGCAFAPRCDRAEERCLSSIPPLQPTGDPHHLFACWNPIPESRP